MTFADLFRRWKCALPAGRARPTSLAIWPRRSATTLELPPGRGLPGEAPPGPALEAHFGPGAGQDPQRGDQAQYAQ